MEADRQEARVCMFPMHRDRPQKKWSPFFPAWLAACSTGPREGPGGFQTALGPGWTSVQAPPHCQLKLPHRPGWKPRAGPHRAPDPSPMECRRRGPGKGAGLPHLTSLPQPRSTRDICPPLGIKWQFGSQKFQARRHQRGHGTSRSLLREHHERGDGTCPGSHRAGTPCPDS